MKKIAFFSSIILLLIFSHARSVFAVAPIFDSSFGDNGINITSFGTQSNVNDMVVQSDGKPVMVGYSVNDNNNQDWQIVRYSKDGDLDSSFGDNGIIHKDFNGQNDQANALIVKSDGKIIVGGYSNPNYKGELIQYNQDGSIDQNFGVNGVRESTQGDIRDLILDAVSGKIIGIGYLVGIDNGHDDVTVARYNLDGSMDTSFGSNGMVVMPVGPTNDRGITGIIQPDGKIVMFGEFDAGGHDEIFLARFNSIGSLDTTFGVSGKIITAIGGSDSARGIVQQSDGKMVIAGTTQVGGLPKMYLARYSVDGELDLGFGADGKVVDGGLTYDDTASSVILNTDGSFFLGGSRVLVNHSTPSQFAIEHITKEGIIDRSFGVDGTFQFSVDENNDGMQTMHKQADGKLLVAGYAGMDAWGIARFNTIDSDLLPVPLLKQTDSQWGNDLYDSANLWSNGSTNIASYGCALTSAAMVFQYNDIKKLPDGDDLNPGTLNTWLKSQSDGYIRNGLVNWLALSRLSMQATQTNSIENFDALDYTRIGHQDDAVLANSLGGNIPPILEEPGHFVVATGTDSANTTFFINDPYYDRSSLAGSYNKTYQSMGIYSPSKTNLSYVMLVVNPNIAVSLLDGQGHNVGLSFIQNPITDDAGNSTNSAGSLKVFYFKQPPDGKYTLKLTANNTTTYNLDEYLYDKNGDFVKSSFNGDITKKTTDSYVINFDQNDKSKDSFDVVNFEYIKNEIINDYKNKEIKNFTTYMSLLTQLEISDNSFSKTIQKAILGNMIKTIKRDKKIDKNASSQLISDIKLLQDSL